MVSGLSEALSVIAPFAMGLPLAAAFDRLSRLDRF